MREFWVVYSGRGHEFLTAGQAMAGKAVAPYAKEFNTYEDAFDFARDRVKHGDGDLYIMKPTHRVSLPVDLETAEDEK